MTFIAISLGILAIFAIILISAGFENSIQAQFEQLGTNQLFVSTTVSGFTSGTFTKGLSDNEVDLIRNRPYVKDVFGYYMRNSQIKFGNDFRNINLMGSTDLSQNFFDTLNVEVEMGRLPKSNEKYVVVIGPEAAANLFDKEIRVGSNVYIKDTKFKVVGILESLGNPQDDSSIYFPIDTLRDLFDDKDKIGFINVIVNENSDINLAKENVKILLENRLGKDTIDVRTLEQLLTQVQDILQIVQYTLGGIAFVSLIVGGFGIINTMFVIVTEKTKDIGIMKAVGATNEQIFFMFTFQAGFFGFIGAVIGVIFGALISFGFQFWANSAGYSFLKITVTPISVISLILFGFIVGALAGFYPAYRASRLQIVETFRK
ncbi:MAG: ABC transporter permease [Candidatus Woesearchaeota archaeon]|nr:ABC transporter permease [Candidatus Woesearchaeota archaeon]